MRNGLNEGGIEGPLSEDLRRELDDLTCELLQDAEELLSDVGSRRHGGAGVRSADFEEGEAANAGGKAPAPPPETLNFPARRTQTPSPIRRRMADAAMSVGELPMARRQTLSSTLDGGSAAEPVTPEQASSDLFDIAAEEMEENTANNGLDAGEDGAAAMEIDAVNARRAAMRLDRRDPPKAQSAAAEHGPVWHEDDEADQGRATEGWGALNNLLRLAENALRDLERHDAARIRRRADIKAQRAEEAAAWFKARPPGRLTRRALTSLAAALARPEDRAQRRDAAASDQMARMVAGARARSIRHVWVDSEKRRAEEEASEVLGAPRAAGFGARACSRG